jgi:hypothetical protein
VLEPAVKITTSVPDGKPLNVTVAPDAITTVAPAVLTLGVLPPLTVRVTVPVVAVT